MPSYTIDMRGQQDGWANAASALAKALTPNYEAEIAGRVAASQVEQNYAGANANNALARERNAAAGLSERELATWGDLDTMFANEGMTPEEREDIFVSEFLPRLGKVDGSNVGDWGLALGGRRGYDDERMSDLQTGAGIAYGSTIDGTREATRNSNQQFLMEQAGLGSRAQQERDDELFPVFDPVSKQPTYTTRPNAIGQQPVLSETDAKGLALQGGNLPGAPLGGAGFAFEGTAMEAQAGNFVVMANEKVRNGQPLTPQEQTYYNLAYNSLFGPKTELRQGPDGQTYSVQIQPAVPPGIMPPGGGSPTITPQAAPAQAAPATAPQPSRVLDYGQGQQLGFGGNLPPAMSRGVAGRPNPALGLLPGQPTPANGYPVAPSPQPAGNAGVSVGGVVPLGTKPPERPTEAAVRQATLGNTFSAGVSDLAAMVGYDPATRQFTGGGVFPDFGTDASVWVEENISGGLGRAVGGDWNNRYRTVAFNVVEPILRLRTGAAAPDAEQLAYRLGLLPQSGVSDQENQFRIRKLFQQVEIYNDVARSLGLNPAELFSMTDMNDPLIQRVRAIAEAKIAESYPEDAAALGEATPAASAAAGETLPPGMIRDKETGEVRKRLKGTLPGGMTYEEVD